MICISTAREVLQMVSNHRINSLDYLRGTIILMVVMFHVSITFMAKAPQWWYVKSDSTNILFTMYVVLADVFMMPVLFFISGFVLSLQKKKIDTVSIVTGRLKRLGIPWIICTLLFAPYLTTAMMKSLGKEATYLNVISKYFWTDYYSQGPYWFLGILLSFSLIIITFKKISFVNTLFNKISPIVIWGLLLILPAVGYFSGSCIYGVDSWINPLFIWSFQPSRILTYFSYFTAGYVLSERDWKIFKNPGRWGFSTVIISILFLILKGKAENSSGISVLLPLSIAYSGLVFSMSFFLPAFFNKYCGMESHVLNFFSKHSFVIYLVHLPILIVVSRWIIYTPIPVFLRFITLLILVLILSLACSFVLNTTKRRALRIR